MALNSGDPQKPSIMFCRVYPLSRASTQPARPAASRSGYSFAGWYSDREEGSLVGPGDDGVYWWWSTIRDNWRRYGSVPATRTVYARWEVRANAGHAATAAGPGARPSAKEVSGGAIVFSGPFLSPVGGLPSGGDAPWTETECGGLPCAESGAIGDGGSSVLRAEVEGSGTLAFRWRTSSEAGRDIAFFSVDGKDVSSRSGLDADWTTVSLRIEGDGPHALSWTYAKDASGSAGDDCARLADVAWIAD